MQATEVRLSSMPFKRAANSWVRYDVTNVVAGDGTYSFLLAGTSISRHSLFLQMSQAYFAVMPELWSVWVLLFPRYRER
jgi:hypothetical protein